MSADMQALGHGGTEAAPPATSSAVPTSFAVPPPAVLSYNLPPPQKRGWRRRSVKVMDHALVMSILEAFIAADGELFDGLVGPEAHRVAMRRLEQRRQRAEKRLRSLEEEVEARTSEIFARSSDGKFRFAEHTRDALLREVDALGEPLEAAKAHLAQVKRDLIAKSETVQSGINNEDLQRLFDGLRNPGTGIEREILRRAVRNLAFTSQRVRRRGATGNVATWTGELLLETPAGTRVIPFSGRHAYGVAATADETALAELSAMRRGKPVWFVSDEVTRRHRSDIADLLGIENRHFTAGLVRDPMLLRLWMAVVHPEPVPGECAETIPTLEDLLQDKKLLSTFGGLDAVEAVVRQVRIAAAYRDNKWVCRRSKAEAALLVRSAVEGSRRGTGKELSEALTTLNEIRRAGRRSRWSRGPNMLPVLLPCQWCGGLWAGLPHLREMTGYLCLERTCRRDEAGVRWPKRYDRYLKDSLAIRAAGGPVSLPPSFTGRCEEMHADQVAPVSFLAHAKVVDEAMAEDFEESYLRGEYLNSIGARHGINPKRVKKVLRLRQVPERGPTGSFAAATVPRPDHSSGRQSRSDRATLD